MEKGELSIKAVIIICIVLLFIGGFTFVIEKKNNQIEEKNNQIEELSNIVCHGCYFEEYSTYGKTSTTFDINEKRCKVKIVDEECMGKLNITSGFKMELNSSNCIAIYEINGTLRKRVY